MAIYTKKGDRGTSSVISTPKGTRISKASLVFDTLGAIDELNSYIGIVVTNTEDKMLIEILENIQNNLFAINSYLAGANIRLPNLSTKRMEKDIDKMTLQMPELINFILPGGTNIASQLHYARTLVRKVERRLVELSGKQKIKAVVLRYVNRLSDYFFTMARWQNYLCNQPDKSWKNLK